MRFTEDPALGLNVIRAYSSGEIRINERVIGDGVIVSATQILVDPTLRDILDLTADHAARARGFDPDIVLLGTGREQHFPPRQFGAEFLRLGIGFEVMDTGAACRTFNVLVAEQRRVVAMLLPR